MLMLAGLNRVGRSSGFGQAQGMRLPDEVSRECAMSNNEINESRFMGFNRGLPRHAKH